MKRRLLFCFCMAFAIVGVAHARDLTNADLLKAALAEGKDAPKAGKLGTYNGQDVIVEQFGEIRIIRYNVSTDQCDDVGGVVRTVATPTGQTGTLQRFCVPGVLMGEAEEPKKETQ